MKGKKYIETVKALQTINGVVEEGGVYKIKDMKRLFPYIDFYSKEYFKTIYPDDRFKVGDRVRYKGNNSKYSLKKDKVYVVRDVSHRTNLNDLLYTTYNVTLLDSNLQHSVDESELELAESKWIISFSNDLIQGKPAVHELEYFAWRKMEKTWRKVFVVDTREEAIRVSEMFSKHDIREIYKMVEQYELDHRVK